MERENYDGLAGSPDGWARLWAPHRMVYLRGENRPKSDDSECPFCKIPTLSDEEGLVVARGSFVYAVLNLYPYNPGHLLVCTYRHVADTSISQKMNAKRWPNLLRRLFEPSKRQVVQLDSI